MPDDKPSTQRGQHELLDRLVDLAGDEQDRTVRALLERARERRLRILVAGEAKRGKSTLINSLLGRAVLPSGVLPVTAISTTVRPDESDAVEVEYLDGRTAVLGLDALAGLVTERDNPHNCRGVADVTVWLRLPGGSSVWHDVELVDTPGTGSVYEHNTSSARQAYASLDAVILVLTADPPMNAADRDLLTEVSAHAVHTFVVVNKADVLAPDELAQTVGFVRGICAGSQLPAGNVFAVSARAGTRDQGFRDLQAYLLDYLNERGARDLDRAIAGHVGRLARELTDRTTVQLRATELSASNQQAQLDQLATALGQLQRRAKGIADRVDSAHRAMLRGLSADADRVRAQIVASTRGAVLSVLDQPHVAPAELEQQAHTALEQVVTAAVLEWRSSAAIDLEGSVRELSDEVQQDRLRQLAHLRHEVQAALGVSIEVDTKPVVLRTGRYFWLDFSRGAVIDVPGTTLVRHHGPGAAGRVRARTLQEVADLTDRCVGRVRADLQERLAQTVRMTRTGLVGEHQRLLAQLAEAVEQGRAVHDAGSEQIRYRSAELRARLAKLGSLVRDAADSSSLDRR